MGNHLFAVTSQCAANEGSISKRSTFSARIGCVSKQLRGTWYFQKWETMRHGRSEELGKRNSWVLLQRYRPDIH